MAKSKRLKPRKSTRKVWSQQDIEEVKKGGRPRDAVLKRIKRANITKLSDDELQYYNEVADIIIKERAARFEKLKQPSPAMQAYQNKVSRQINKNNPRRAANLAQDFFRAKTSTLKGAKEWHEKQRKINFGDETDSEQEDFTFEEWKEYFDFYEDFDRWAKEVGIPSKDRRTFLVKTGIWAEPNKISALRHAKVRAAAKFNKNLQEFGELNMPLTREEIVRKFMDESYFDMLPDEEQNDIIRWAGINPYLQNPDYTTVDFEEVDDDDDFDPF